MKTSFFLITLILLLYCVQFVYSQDNEQDCALEMKYWAYRYRLSGDDFDRNIYPGFIVIGNEPGKNVLLKQNNILPCYFISLCRNLKSSVSF